MLEISSPNVVLSALKPARHGTIAARVFEATGTKSDRVEIKFATAVQSAEAVNALGDLQGAVKSSDRSVMLDLHPFEIKTVRVELSPREQGK
jgi:alpha-mannosidase